MKSWVRGFVAGALLFGALPLVAEEVIRIVPGSGDPLGDRVKRLELAVAQLQGQVYGPGVGAAARSAPGAAGAAGAGVVCRLDTPFDGEFSASNGSEAEASEAVVEKCKARTKSGIYCVKRDVKCSR